MGFAAQQLITVGYAGSNLLKERELSRNFSMHALHSQLSTRMQGMKNFDSCSSASSSLPPLKHIPLSIAACLS